mmetsp:Transcript_9096/g.10059  ORF Transcript_9096/g.10059 Transcript_9096/m.10059 type:complete len:122 (-) Transcript_9096:1093-1458(-)
MRLRRIIQQMNRTVMVKILNVVLILMMMFLSTKYFQMSIKRAILDRSKYQPKNCLAFLIPPIKCRPIPLIMNYRLAPFHGLIAQVAMCFILFASTNFSFDDDFDRPKLFIRLIRKNGYNLN